MGMMFASGEAVPEGPAERGLGTVDNETVSLATYWGLWGSLGRPNTRSPTMLR